MSETTRYPVSFWCGTRAQYAAIATKSSNTLYFISDDNTLYRGTEPFARDIKKLLCFAATAPTTATIGDEYYNSTDKKVHICTASSAGSTAAVWDAGTTPQSALVYYDTTNAQIASWNGTAMVDMCNSASATAAASSASAAAGSATAAAGSASDAEDSKDAAAQSETNAAASATAAASSASAAAGAVSTHNAATDAHSSLFAATAKHADTIPTAAASLVGQTYIYTGTTDSNFTNGHTYQCKEDSGAYSWVDLTPAPDLTGVARSIDTMPTAGASYADQVYIYTGETSATYKHGHLYQCKLNGSTYSWVDVQTGLYGVGNLSGIKCFVIGTTVSVKWSDPADTKIGDVTVAKWGKTVLVRKSGSYPASVDDGTVLVSSTTRDAYKSTAFNEQLPSGTTYYYRWFIYTDDGVLNDNTVNEAVTGGLTWESILDMCADPTIDMRDVFSAGDVLTAANSIRATDGNGNFQWQVTDVTHDDFGVAAYKVFANLQFDAPQKAYGLTADTTFASWKLLTLTGYSTTNGTYFLKDETATGTNRVWRRRTGTMEIKYINGSWIVFNTSTSTTAATQTTAATDPWDGAWSNSVVVAKDKKYYTNDGAGNYTEATVTDGDAVTANTYYEKNPHDNRVSYGSNDYEGSPIDQMLNTASNAGTYLVNNTIWSNSPSWASSQDGFMKGFDPDFLAAVKDTTITLNLNAVTAGGGQKTITRKFYLLSSTEVGLASGEGTVLDFYNGAEASVRIKYNTSGGAQYWWLRSPLVGSSYFVYSVRSSGALTSTNASGANGCVPACRIGSNQ